MWVSTSTHGSCGFSMALSGMCSQHECICLQQLTSQNFKTSWMQLRRYKKQLTWLSWPSSVQVLFEAQGRGGKNKSVEMEDIKFHQCVRLARFENDRTISFIPPDGAFDLMCAPTSNSFPCHAIEQRRSSCMMLKLLHCARPWTHSCPVHLQQGSFLVPVRHNDTLPFILGSRTVYLWPVPLSKGSLIAPPNAAT